MYRRVDFPPLTLSKNPDEAIRITGRMAMASGLRQKSPQDRLRAEMLNNSTSKNEEVAQQWTDALRLIFSEDMRETSRRVLGSEYEFAYMGASAMYQNHPPSAYRIAVWLDVAPDTLVNYAQALVRYGYI